MKVVLINKSDSTGGAAVVSFRLLEALRNAGVDASMLVTEKKTDSPFVHLAASTKRIMRSFLAERLNIFISNGFNRKTLFKIDTASDGLPLHRHPLVKEADVVCLNWVNQGMLSLKEIGRIAALGKPIVWTMHDMWCLTGICHHAGSCRKFTATCHNCPLLGSRAGRNDLSTKIMKRKNALYSSYGITFVAVSRWLRDRAHESSLLKDMRIEVIPNAFPITKSDIERELSIRESKDAISSGKKVKIVFGAARLDDPIKGLPILVEATRILAKKYPSEAARMELVTFGGIKDPSSLSGIGIKAHHSGIITGAERIRDIYRDGDIVVSTSLYETLPGTLVEGQAYGCIPVSFNRGGQGDIVESGVTGWLCEFNDTSLQANAESIADGIVKAAHASIETRRKMAENVIDKFSAESVAKKYISLFNTLISRH